MERDAGRAKSLNYLIRPQQQRRRNRQAECLGGLEVDDEFEFRRLLDGQITRFGALQDFVDIGRNATVGATEFGAYVMRPPTSANSVLPKIDGR